MVIDKGTRIHLTGHGHQDREYPVFWAASTSIMRRSPSPLDDRPSSVPAFIRCNGESTWRLQTSVAGRVELP